MIINNSMGMSRPYASSFIFCMALLLLLPLRVAGTHHETVYTMPAASDLTSDQWEIRRTAFAKLIGPPGYPSRGLAKLRPVLLETLEKSEETAEERKIMLIQLLEAENSYLESQERVSEDYTEYYADVILVVTTLKDPRSVNALVGAINSGGMATRTLISFGIVSVEPVVRALITSDPSTRSSLTRILSRMLVESNDIAEDAASRSMIKQALTLAAKDTYPIVRRGAIDGLMALGDQKSIGLVKEMAEFDPYKTTYPPIGRYIVRERARKALGDRR